MSLCFQSALHQGETGGGAAGPGRSAADLRGDAAGVAEPLRPRPLQVTREAVVSKKKIYNSNDARTRVSLEFREENINSEILGVFGTFSQCDLMDVPLMQSNTRLTHQLHHSST